MADAFITTGADDFGASGIKALVTFFADFAIDAKENRNSIIQHCNNNVSMQIGSYGQAVNVPLYSTVTPATVTDGNLVPKDNTVGSGRTVTLNRLKDVSWGFTDLAASLTANTPALGIMKQRVADLFNDRDDDVCSLAASDLNTNSVGAFSTPVSEAILASAVQKLYENKVPKGELHGFLSPKAWSGLITIDNIVRAYSRGDANPMVTDDPDLIKWNGVKWHMHQGVNTNNTTETSNFVMYKDAILFASRSLECAPSGSGVIQQVVDINGTAVRLSCQYTLDYKSTRWSADWLYGYSSGEEKFGVEVRTLG